MSVDTIIPRRSLLYMPASRPEMFPKAIESGADVVCVDLEDATADRDKDASRIDAINLAATNKNPKVESILRINGLRTREGLLDLAALATQKRAPDGILIPKIRSAEEVRIVRDVIGVAHPGLGIHVQLETNDGLENAREIAKAAHKVKSIVFGGFDMSSSLRVEPSWNALLYARQRLVHAAASAHVDIIDMPNFDLDDPVELPGEAQRALEIGFTGKCAIHPKQVAAINAVFTPSEKVVARAKQLIAKFEAQDQAFTIIDGIVMEKPVVERLYRTIAISERISR